VDTRTVGELTINRPAVDPDELAPLDEPPDDDVAEFRAEGADWAGLELAGALVDRGLLRGVDLTGAGWRNVTLRGCRLENVDLSGAGLTGLTIERCEFSGCRLTGLQLAKTTLKHVTFTDCRFDYARLDEVRATGPVAWLDCGLGHATLTRCRLPTTALAGCRLEGLELDECDLRGTDLRGTELAGLKGLSSLRGATIDSVQLEDLAVLAARELDLDVR